MRRGNLPGKSGQTNTGNKDSNAANKGQHKRTPTILKVEEYTDRNAVTATKVTETALDVSGAPKESKRSTGAVVPAAPEAPKAPSQRGSLNVRGTARSELQTGREDSVWGGDALGSPQSTASASTRSFSFAETPAHSRGPSVSVQPKPRSDVPNLGDKFERAKAIDQKGVHAKKPSIQETPVFLSPRGTHRNSTSMPTTNRRKDLPKLMIGDEEYDPKRKQESDTAREDRWRLEIKNFQKSKEYKGDETGRRRNRINEMFQKQNEEYKAYVSFVDAELLNNPDDTDLLAEKTVLSEFEAEQDDAVLKSIEKIRKDLLENLVVVNLKSYADFVDFFARAYIKFEERGLELEKITVLRLSEQINYFIDKFDLFIEGQVLENLPLDEQKAESKLPDNLAVLANQHIQNLITQTQSNLTGEEVKLYKQFFDRMRDILTKEGIEKAAEAKKIWGDAKTFYIQKCPQGANPIQKLQALKEVEAFAAGMNDSLVFVPNQDAKKALSKKVELYSKFVGKQKQSISAEMPQEEVKAVAPTVPTEHKRSAQQQSSPQPAPKTVAKSDSSGEDSAQENIKALQEQLKTEMRLVRHYYDQKKHGSREEIMEAINFADQEIKKEMAKYDERGAKKYNAQAVKNFGEALRLLRVEKLGNYKEPVQVEDEDERYSEISYGNEVRSQAAAKNYQPPQVDSSPSITSHRISQVPLKAPARGEVKRDEILTSPRTAGSALLTPTAPVRRLDKTELQLQKEFEKYANKLSSIAMQAHFKQIQSLENDLKELKSQALAVHEGQQRRISELEALVQQLRHQQPLPPSEQRRPRTAPSSGRKPIDPNTLVQGTETKAGVPNVGARVRLLNEAGSDNGSSQEGPEADVSVQRVDGGYVPVSAPVQEFKRTGGPINAQGTLAELASPRPQQQRLVPKSQAELQEGIDKLKKEKQALVEKSPEEIQAERLQAELAKAAQASGQNMPKQESSVHASEDEDSIVEEPESSAKAQKNEKQPQLPKRKGPGCTIM